jgi:hypothetical protein
MLGTHTVSYMTYRWNVPQKSRDDLTDVGNRVGYQDGHETWVGNIVRVPMLVTDTVSRVRVVPA